MTRWKTRAVALLTAALGLALVPGPALAQEAVLTDPAGDARNEGLDFVRVKLSSLDHRIVVRARFVKAKRGDVIVAIQPPGDRGVRLVSEYRPKGTTRNFVLAGGFRARGTGPTQLACPGFKVVWRPAKELARMSLPSTCLNDGDYGAVRFTFLSERGGSDTDGASEISPRIPRG